MAATAGLVGALLMHICTNYEAIMNGTRPDGELTAAEQGSGVGLERADFCSHRAYWHVLG